MIHHETRNQRGQQKHYAKRHRVRLWLMAPGTLDPLAWPLNTFDLQAYYRLAKRDASRWPDFVSYLRGRMALAR